MKNADVRVRVRHALIAWLCGLWGMAGAVSFPWPGSGRADLWVMPGQRVGLPGVPAGSRIDGLPRGFRVFTQNRSTVLQVPVNAAPGRVDLGVRGSRPPRTLAVEVMSPVQPRGETVRGEVQLLVNPQATRDVVQDLLNSKDLGQITLWEQLGRALATGRVSSTVAGPCDGILVTVTLSPGLDPEAALNALTALDSTGATIWYSDPILSYGNPAAARPATAQSSLKTRGRVGFGYPEDPGRDGSDPRTILGTPKSGSTGAGVTIAVLDTGFGKNGQIPNQNAEFGGRVMPSLNATVALTAPYYHALSTQADDFWEGHGTQVAQLAAGTSSGVATGAQVRPVKVCQPGQNNRSSCLTRDVVRGLCLTLNTTPDLQKLVINLSLGGKAPVQSVHAVLNWAATQGVITVASGGNQGQNGNPAEYPAAFTQPSTMNTQVAVPMLAVPSVRLTAPATWVCSTFSTVGTYLSLSAPGEELKIGTQPYRYSGTSFAAPLVAGAAAVLLQTRAASDTTPVVVNDMVTNRVRSSMNCPAAPMLDLSKY